MTLDEANKRLREIEIRLEELEAIIFGVDFDKSKIKDTPEYTEHSALLEEMRKITMSFVP